MDGKPGSFQKIKGKWNEWRAVWRSRAQFRSLQKNLKRGGSSRLPTVYFSELQANGFIRLDKEESATWRSSFDHLRHLTPQSDPRNPIFLFGAELAFKMGFRIGKAENGSIYMLVPGAKRLAAWIRRINVILKAKGYEPISYSLEKSDFVSPSQALEMMTKPDPENDILLHFPYSDENPKLTVHEVSFHLGAILFPRKFIQRGYDINIRTQQFINFLASKESELGPITKDVIEQILSDRGYENDAGTAEIVSGFANLREMNTFLSHAGLVRLITEPSTVGSDEVAAVDFINRAIDFYARPYMSPLAAVVFGLHKMTGINVSDLDVLPKNNIWKFSRSGLFMHSIHRTVYLSPEEKHKFKEIVKNFVDLYKYEEAQAHYELLGPEEWLRFLGEELDIRINQLLEAASELPD
ncbi:MAG: hypothetical protein A4S09_03280 [Proteobacteria bacterium SG_bin7]|nr:MAG: hypothetical protein A4S09_03280 [Proteobacteria bacterium SG_bin7]